MQLLYWPHRRGEINMLKFSRAAGLAAAAFNLGQDKAWMAMREIVARLIAEEQQGLRGAAVSA
jgi:hypothetical protein